MEFPKVQLARDAFASGKTLPLDFRRRQLENLLRMVEDKSNQKLITEALFKDLRKSQYEVETLEINTVVIETLNILRNFDEYTGEKVYPKSLGNMNDKLSLTKTPLGLVIIFGAWNYPFVLSMRPLAGAIAAGNTVIIKPSEMCTHTERLIGELVPKYLDNECYHVIPGDAKVSQALLKNRFDHIFFTGSTNVGRQVLQAAAPFLTPVTLELGGKCPVYMDESGCTEMGVRRIIWGKIMNSGQICMAPDYLLCRKELQPKIVKLAESYIEKYYGSLEGLQKQNTARILNVRHFQRLKKLLEATRGSVLLGGKTEESDLWIEPTVVGDVKAGDSLMDEEIFGPILSIIPVESQEEAIQFINSRPRPLALYVFSKDEGVKRDFITRTISGGICINDVMFHTADLRLPFGGVGESGMGRYYGRHSVDTFSHHRTVMDRTVNPFFDSLDSIRYPPYTAKKSQKVRKITRILDYTEFSFSRRSELLLVLLMGLVIGYLFSLFSITLN